LAELAGLFDLAKLSRAPARFDFEELKALNAKTLQDLDYESAAPRLRELGIEAGADFWETVRPNLSVFGEVRNWWTVISGPVTPRIEDEAFVEKAAELLPSEPWSGETWGEWTGEVKQATGAKGKALFQPLRLALTGQDHGPELKRLLPLIGREKTLARLRGLAI
jgi:glutamyl-tRNA synthetase